MRPLINEGPFTAVERDGEWTILDGVGARVATVHGEWAYHDAPILAERMNVAGDIVELREENARLEDDSEEREGELRATEEDLHEARADAEESERDLRDARAELEEVKSKLAELEAAQ